MADRYITGGCPKCNAENAYGDQCEKCGSALSPTELINPKSTLSGKIPELKKTTHWYLPLERHEKWLREWIYDGKYKDEIIHDVKKWKNQVVGQCMSWINAGLQPRAITRDLDWGVKVPLEDGDGKVLYVWFDAPIGYISATKKWAIENGKNWEDFWKRDDTNLVHFLAKDNIVFHTIIFPAILSQLDRFILPKNVPANEFLNLEGQKLSTSRNWAVWAHEYLNDFVQKNILNYGLDRDFPSIKGTSLLSPYIRNGQINVGDIWQRCKKLKSKNVSVKKYTNEIGWREFSHSLINYFPQMLKGNLRKEFDKFPWVNNSKFLNAWKKGMTGYPIVDAGMRELYETGWMHNRIRMVVGSFLVKHLRINWQEGEKYFRNCLLDFNEANNVAQWQWVAGCGADAAPYFRIFNPILQGEKFDKQGEYVKKWVPELSKVPSKFIHKPWEMEKKYQEAINTIIGVNYPMPIVIHEKARADALSAFQSIKKKN